ncbi:MAG: hypothetical protein ACOC0N_04185 [Chroococcales cyanobacterium]
MKAIANQLTALLNPVRFLLAVFACTLLIFSQALPAYSATSSPTKGEDSLPNVLKESEKVIYSEEPAPGYKESLEKTNPQGLNAVQGAADAEKQYRPSDSDEETVENRLGNILENVKGEK